MQRKMLMFLTYLLSEGQRYKYSNSTVESTIPRIRNAQYLRGVIESKKGDTFNASEVEKTKIALAEAVIKKGHPFATVVVRNQSGFKKWNDWNSLRFGTRSPILY